MSVGTAIAVASTVWSAKTAIEGLKEGNLLQAALGGIGAYYGASGLSDKFAGKAASQVAGTTSGANTAVADKVAGANAIDQMAATEAASQGGSAMTSAAEGASASLADKAGSGMYNAAGMTPSGAGFADAAKEMDKAIAMTPSGAGFTGPSGSRSGLLSGGANGSIAPVAPATHPGAEQSFFEATNENFGDVMEWMDKNPNAASNMLQVGGGLLQGYAEDRRYKDMVRRLEAERRRRGTTADTGFLNDVSFNPNTGWRRN